MNKQASTMQALLAVLLLSGSALAWAEETDAEVKKIDKAQARVTLKHGAIKSLDMPPMTMTLQVRNPAMLASVAEGDKVRVLIEKVDGRYTVMTMTRAN